MPFAMTHLYIAFNLINNAPQIKNPCDFLLGALAPDSVHFRENYNSDMKKRSHLCVGDERWGRLTNNTEWLENVSAFLRENEHSENRDFIYGYCSHIFADIQNNIKIWTPYVRENIEALEKGAASVYHQESIAMDYVLYELHPQKTILWKMLEDAAGYTVADIAFRDEIERMKYDILHNQFSQRKSADVSLHRYVTLSGMQEFIAAESQYITGLLFKDE